MNTSIATSILFLSMFSFYDYECNGQSNELQRPDSTNITDTLFFEIDSKYKNDFIEFEVMPEFPGGEKALINYISEKTIYPESAIKDSISGLVRLIFVVDVDGSTNNFKIHKSVRSDVDNECIRVVKEMPKWKPGSNVFRSEKGLYRKIIPVYYLITFNFVLQGTGNFKGIIIRPMAGRQRILL
jgi:protein TonB